MNGHSKSAENGDDQEEMLVVKKEKEDRKVVEREASKEKDRKVV